MEKISSPTTYRKELRDRILVASMDEFRKLGIRQVKMDDIANKLAISKRTLYEIYANKEKLLLECIKQSEEKINQQMRDFSSDPNHNVIDIIIEYYDTRIKNSSDVNPCLFEEMRKYPEVLEFFDTQHKERQVAQQVFFKRGLEEGYFRDDVDFEIVSMVGDASMKYVMQNQVYRNFKLDYILHNIILLYVRGICTEDGVAKLDELLAERGI